MNKKVVLGGIIVVVSLLFLVSCEKKEEVKKIEVSPTVTTTEEATAEVPPPPAEPVAPVVNLSCTTNANCAEGKSCIDGKCGTLAELYKTDCAQKCNFGSIVVTTSDGETYPVTKGQGSYTAAGALQWKIESIPDYCSQEKVRVPFEVKMVNYGNILRQYYLTLQQGETSEVMEHPVVPNIHFTLTLKSVEEKCS